MNAIAKQITKTKKGVSRNYKSYLLAFRTLQQKGLVKPVTSKEYRNREYLCLWLTELGIFAAVHERAKTETLLKRAREIYPEDKDLHLVIEAAPILGQLALDVLFLAAMNRGAINQTDLISIFAAQTANKLTPNQIAEFIRVLKKYPEQHQQTRTNLRELADLL